MSQPRIAFVTNLCPYYRRPLYELLARRLDVTFYFFSKGEERYVGPAVRHEEGDFPIRDVRRISLAGHPLLVGLERELVRTRYDAVVKCINGRLMMPYVYSLAQRRKLPFVLWTGIWHHPQTAAHRLTRPLVEAIYRGSDAIVTYGEHVKRFVSGAPGVSPSKVYVAGQAVDTSAFSEVQPDFVDQPEILFIGQLESHKGIDDLLAAFKRIGDPKARLRLIGSGMREAIVQRACAHDRRIRFEGAVPHSRLPDALRVARCLVLPAVTTKRYKEAWGLVINEAMAAGLPVVATDAVGAAAGGLVRDGWNGFVVPERRPSDLAAAIERLIADSVLARTFGERARQDVAEFDYDRMAGAFSEAIDHAIASTDPGLSPRAVKRLVNPTGGAP